ncbi:nuclear factor Y, subunit C10 [Trifolium repens]|nr:nuclear factor Y, subunit C10 [Trifolium repens]
MNRIRTILKGEISDLRVSQEAVLAINKAAEKFLEQLAQEAYVCSVQDRKKFLSYNHLSRVVGKQRRYDFLSDFVPEKVKAEDALRETNLRGNRGG